MDQPILGNASQVGETPLTMVGELVAEIAATVEQRVAHAIATRESEIAKAAERRSAHAMREAELAQRSLVETRAAHDADVAVLEAECDAARGKTEGLRKALDLAHGRIEGLTVALKELSVEVRSNGAKRKGKEAAVEA